MSAGIGAAMLAKKSVIKNNNMWNQELAKKLHKAIIRKFEKRKVHSSLKDNIWGADLGGVELISKFNKGIPILLCVIDIFSKYAWVFPLKDKKGVIITNPFQKILDELDRKPKKIWIDKGSEFYKRSTKSWLKDHGIDMYSTHNERKSVVAERFCWEKKLWEHFVKKNCKNKSKKV